MYRWFVCAAVFLTFVGTAGCGDDPGEDPSPPTPPSTLITEPPFTGTLTVNGAVAQPFTTVSAGPVNAILKSAQPQAIIGIALGTWNGTSCQWITANDNTGIGSGISAIANGAGNLCARVYDVGKLTGPVSFEVSITHH
jgi:hypothetical protein